MVGDGRAMSHSKVLSKIFYLSSYVFLRFFIRPYPHSCGGCLSYRLKGLV